MSVHPQFRAGDRVRLATVSHVYELWSPQPLYWLVFDGDTVPTMWFTADQMEAVV